MAILNMNQLFDKLQEYIDKKIDSVEGGMEELFLEYGVKIVANNIEEVETVALNISHVITNASNIPSIVKCSQNMMYIKAAPESAINAYTYMTQTQAYRDEVIASTDDSYVNAMIAEAESLTADSYADEPEDIPVKNYYYNEATDSIEYVNTSFFSAYHWSEKSKQNSLVILRGTWDMSSCTFPPNDTVHGAVYIIDSDGGASCPEYTVGDWLMWDNSLLHWELINWNFDWNAITNIPDNVNNAFNRLGDTLYGDSIVLEDATEGYPEWFYHKVDGTKSVEVGVNSNHNYVVTNFDDLGNIESQFAIRNDGKCTINDHEIWNASNFDPDYKADANGVTLTSSGDGTLFLADNGVYKGFTITGVSHNDLLDRDLPQQHPISAIDGLQDAIDLKLDTTVFDAHEAAVNPHGITVAMIGAAEEVHVHAIADITDLQNTLDGKASGVDLTDHTSNVANPHVVTKAQVGLANVDNTSDIDKPISTVTQTALDGKSDSSHLHDDRYYQETEFLNASGGVNDAGKPIVLNSDGLIDNSMMGDGTYLVGYHTPVAGTEYPDLTGHRPGAYWIINGVDDINGYTFTEGDLAGEIAYNGNLMINGSVQWVLVVMSFLPTDYYKLDGSQAITADFQAGQNSIVNLIDVVDYESLPVTNSVTVGQLKRLNADDVGAAWETHGHTINSVEGLWTELGSKATQTSLDDHTGATDNPHAVTAIQVGAEPADPAIQNHLSDTGNPHSVTQVQIGLDQVDNTSDLDKPISTATQAALNDKTDVGHTHTISDIPDFDIGVSTNVDVITNTSARHTHSNSTVLDTITDSGDGSMYLSDDGTYKLVENDSQTYLDLTDTPDDYTGQTGNVSVVNGTEDGLSWYTIPTDYVHYENIDADQLALVLNQGSYWMTSITDAPGTYVNGTLIVTGEGDELQQTWSSGDELFVRRRTGGIFDSWMSVSGIEEAPQDGNPYGRQDIGWVSVDPAGSADTVQSNLNDHIADTTNPHSVTATQINAVESLNTQTTVPACTGIETLTQAEYDGLTPDANTMYMIVG